MLILKQDEIPGVGHRIKLGGRVEGDSIILKHLWRSVFIYIYIYIFAFLVFCFVCKTLSEYMWTGKSRRINQSEPLKPVETFNPENQKTAEPSTTSFMTKEDRKNVELIKNHEWTEYYITLPKESRLEKVCRDGKSKYIIEAFLDR